MKFLIMGLFAFVFVLIILVIVPPLTAYASESDFVIEDGLLVKYNGPGGDVTIPNGVSAIGENAFSDCTMLTSIAIPEGVTEIKNWAFAYCDSLIGVVIPESVELVGNGAFKGCKSLTSVIIPEGVTRIDRWAFNGCASLEEITLPVGITTLEQGQFQACTSLTRVHILGDISDFDATNVFAFCESLNGVYITGSGGAYTDIDGVVFNKEKTELVFFPSGRTGTYAIPDGVTAIASDAFEYLELSDHVYRSQIESIIVPDSVTSFGKDVFPRDAIIYGGAKSAVKEYARKNKYTFRTGDPLTNPPSSPILEFWWTWVPAVVFMFFWANRHRRFRVSVGKGNCIGCGRETRHAYTYYSGKIEDVQEGTRYTGNTREHVTTTTYSDIRQHYNHLCPSCMLRVNLKRAGIAMIPMVIFLVYVLPDLQSSLDTFPVLSGVLSFFTAYFILHFLLRLARVVFRLKGEYNDAAEVLINHLPKQEGMGYLTPDGYANLKSTYDRRP